MKILYLDFNIIYHNPTRNNIIPLLKNIGELYVYGPGYQSDEILNNGVEKFYFENGPFDFVIVNEHIVFHKNIDKYSTEMISDSYIKDYFFQFSLDNFKKTIKDMVQFYFSNHNDFKKVVFLLESDYFYFSKESICVLKDSDIYVVGWGQDMVANTEVLEDLKKETFYKYANNNWFDFVQNNPNIIQITHFVNSSEFYFECLENRKNIAYVAGVNYFHREKAIEELKKSKYYKEKMKLYPKLYSLARKFGLRPDANPVLIRLYNSLFRNKLENSKYVFTCGSGVEYPIRKFFEIPALGALLLAKPFYGSDKLGFVDGKNYIKTDYRDIKEKIDFLESNRKLAQQIAKNGQDMIWEMHSLSARAKQLKSSFDLILKDNYNGSYWENGKFLFY